MAKYFFGKAVISMCLSGAFVSFILIISLKTRLKYRTTSKSTFNPKQNSGFMNFIKICYNLYHVTLVNINRKLFHSYIPKLSIILLTSKKVVSESSSRVVHLKTLSSNANDVNPFIFCAFAEFTKGHYQEKIHLIA